MDYELCDVNTPANCETATVTVVVEVAAPVADDDVAMATAPGPVQINPMANDNGPVPLDPKTVTLTGTGAPGNAILSSDGKTLTLPGQGIWSVNPTTGIVTFTPDAGFSGSPTPAAYTIADVLGKVSNEATLSVTILPAIPIIATDDAPITLNGGAGETSTASVLDNDTLGGITITDPSLVEVTAVTVPVLPSGSITVNPDGTLTVAPGTTPGTYAIEYQICEVSNPTNCATATAEIVVLETESLIAEIEDDLTAILEEDFINTLTQQSRQISGYSADALDHLRGRGHNRCLADVNARLERENILFDTDKAIIKPESQRLLDELAVILGSCAGSAFEIAGHTDSDASDAYNLDLSQRRVEAVLRALTARGVDTTNYIAQGYGESQPIASNATEAGKAKNRRVEFRALNDLEAIQSACNDRFELVRSFDLSADGDGVNADGQFLRDRHTCVTDSREVFEGSLSFTRTGQDQEQSAINLSYRRENYRGSDSVFGYFLGLYGSKSDVTNRANGEIRGLGVNAGIYGAKRLQNDLFVDYYLGGAAGRHKFDLFFARSVGTISATGDYSYVAGFAGAALSGELEYGQTTITPRVGFDYVYSPGADVDAIAEFGGLSDIGNLDLDAVSGGRLFLELRTDRVINDGQTNLWFNPRIACYQSLGDLSGTCGYGFSVGTESAAENSELSYAFELDGEWGDDYFMGSLKARASRQLGIGFLNGDVTMNSDGDLSLGTNFQMDF